MNSKQLLEAYRIASEVGHNPKARVSDRVRARKETVLAELESAYILIYQQRDQQAIKAELASQEARKVDSKRKSDRIIDNNYNIIKTNYKNNYSIISKEEPYKYFTEPEPKKVDPKETAIANWAFGMAQNAVRQDERLKRFRQRVDTLEARGQTDDLEAILTATHNASVMIGVSAQDFLTTFEAVPEQDQVAYATATANLFHDQTGGWSGNPLLSHSEWNQNGEFFSEVREVYRQLGAEVGSNWLRHANALFGEDWSRGRDFAVKSRPTLTAYCKSLGWDLETFVRDYHFFGKPLFEVANVTTKFSAFNPKRKSALVRHLVDSKDEATIKELKDARLPEPELVEGLLPEEMSVQDLIASVKITSGLYELCNNSRVDSRLVSHRLQRAQRAENLDGYVRTLQAVEEQAKEFIAFADEQRKDPNMNLGFNDLKSQETLEIYQEVLGKNFAQFRRDFEATGTDFQKLPEISRRYAECLGDERLRAVLNYVAKHRNRDLINDLANPAPEDLVKTSVAKLGDAGKEDTVKALRELNKTWSFLRDVGANQILVERLGSLPDSSGGNAVINAIAGSRRQCYSAVTGDVEVPKGLEQMVDNVVVGYYKNS